MSARINRSRYRPLPKPAKGTQRLLKYPILLIVIIVVLLELLVYFILRAGVIAYEQIQNICYCRKSSNVRRSLSNAKNYHQYSEFAKKLDEVEKKTKWKSQNESYCYDLGLVQHTLETMKTYQKDNDYVKLSNSLIETFNHCLKFFEDESLFTQTNYGTKFIVDDFIHSVEDAIKTVRNCQSSELQNKDKLKVFCRLQQEFGRTCLCLSGGAGMAFHQYGVIKTLFDSNLLPQIISGCSGGALVGCGVAVRTDEELKSFLNANVYTYLNAADEPFLVRLRRLLTTGYMFDWDDWKIKLRDLTKGDMTFLEAFELTGRIFNVCAISTNHSPVLLNYKTTPNICIWSAVIASSSLPMCMKPSPLIQKVSSETSKSGYDLKEFNSYGKLWCDGSVQFDIPKQRLLEDFNVKYTICVQCNPHVFVFFYNERGTANAPIRHWGSSSMRGGFLSSFLEKTLKLELRKWMTLLSDFDLIPQVFKLDLRFTAIQENRGTVTINPKPNIMDYLLITSDPDCKRMNRMFEHGKSITYPFLYMIQNRMNLQNTIRETIQCLDEKGEVLEQLLNEGYNLKELHPDILREIYLAPVSPSSSFRRGRRNSM